MSGITQRELDSIREAQTEFITDEGTIKRREFFGDTEQAYYPIDGNPYKVRITPGFGVWRTVADRFQGITAYTLTVYWDVAIRAGDVVVVGERVFEVRDVKAPSTYLTATQCLCDLTTDG